jgi:hypothetical protein
MVKPSSFSVICTSKCANELVGLLLSLSIFHGGAKVYVICDTKTKRVIDEITPKPRLAIRCYLELDTYDDMNRQEMERTGLFGDFLSYKMKAMDYALSENADTLLLDSDIIITDVLDDIDSSKEVGLSPQFIKQEYVDKTGFYNAGMLWTNTKSVTKSWLELINHSHSCPEQINMTQLTQNYNWFEFGDNYNLQCWRMYLSSIDINPFITSKVNDKLYYKNKPLKFIHTHFYDKRLTHFNELVLSHLRKANMYKILAIIYRVINGAWVLTIPQQPIQGMGRHNNDSYRELPVLFKVQNRDVDVRFSDNTIHCWIEPNLLTYDRPTLEWCNDEIRRASLILLGNGDVKVEGERLKRLTSAPVKPWTFWPRRPMLLEKILRASGTLTWENRTVGSIFIGNFENSVQARFRNTDVDWGSATDEYHCTAGTKHKFTHEEYLLKLRTAKYGLCLRGYGSKCHREVELMAFGTVPIVADGVTTESYMEPLIENVHFIKVISPSEIRPTIGKIPQEKWNEMSKACYEWYQRNVISKNAWTNMIEHILYD